MGSPGAKDGPSGDRSDGSTDHHGDGRNSGAQDSRAGGANPHCTSGDLPAIPDHVSANDHGSTANHHLRSTNNLLRSTNNLCSSNHLVCRHLWRRSRWWRSHWRLWWRLNHHVEASSAKLRLAVDEDWLPRNPFSSVKLQCTLYNGLVAT